jgi:hypothetical protein
MLPAIDTDPSSTEGTLRRYSSFVIRRWELPAGRERIEVSHLQSGRQATVASLDQVARCIERLAAEGEAAGGAGEGPWGAGGAPITPTGGEER